MKLNELKILYVCTEFPYPPVSGGLVDMWNRIRALHRLGARLDVIVTAAAMPADTDREKVEALVHRLIFCKRESGRKGILSLKAGPVAIRSSLRTVKLEDQYDVVLMQTEFTSDILRNKTLRHKVAIVRVDNDEYAFHLQTAKAERSLLLKLYFLMEALRVRIHASRILPAMDMLWFVSHDELGRYRSRYGNRERPFASFLPTAADLSLMDRPALHGAQVLFVGNLWGALNREAVDWYIRNVHERLSDVPGYNLAVAGSAMGKRCSWLEELTRPYSNILVYLDPKDLTQYFRSSAVFVNPMQRGAGVKLKTIEAVIRGLPIVSTGVGAEGSGLLDNIHYKRADSAMEFAARIKEFLSDRESASAFVSRSQQFVAEQYDQEKVLTSLLQRASASAAG